MPDHVYDLRRDIHAVNVKHYAWLDRYPARRRLGGFQGAVAYLVALVALAVAAPPALTLSASVTAAAQHGSRLPAAQAAADSLLAGDDQGLTAAASRLYTVQAGDCPWSIAQRYLGAGDLYPEIARLDFGRDMGNGRVFKLRRRYTCSPGALRRGSTAR